MMRHTVILLLLFMLAPIAVEAQIYREPSTTRKVEDPYKDLPKEKDFDMGALKDSYLMYLDEIKVLMQSKKTLIEKRHHKCNFYARRFEFFAGHPYFEKATGIKRTWVAGVAKGLRFIGSLVLERERAEMNLKREQAKQEEAMLETAREKFEEILKSPEKVEKEKNK